MKTTLTDVTSAVPVALLLNAYLLPHTFCTIEFVSFGKNTQERPPASYDDVTS